MLSFRSQRWLPFQPESARLAAFGSRKAVANTGIDAEAILEMATGPTGQSKIE
jgi:hypothetical protein